ncbi:hypothetical protein PRIPAC_81547, partial [Pristionchus pacificus]
LGLSKNGMLPATGSLCSPHVACCQDHTDVHVDNNGDNYHCDHSLVAYDFERLRQSALHDHCTRRVFRCILAIYLRPAIHHAVFVRVSRRPSLRYPTQSGVGIYNLDYIVRAKYSRLFRSFHSS